MINFVTNHHRNMNGDKMVFGSEFPHMVELYDEGALGKDIVIMGASQIGKTDWLIISILAMAFSGLNVFYVLPTLEMKNKYVSEKIMKPIKVSSFYQDILNKGVAKSKEQMQFGSGIIRFVGSNVRSEMTSFSADAIVVDETDETDNNNLHLGFSRINKSIHKIRRFVSNPTTHDGFISEWYNLSDQRVWKCPCDKCGQFSEIDWFKSIVRPIENEDGDVIDYRLRDKEWEAGCGRDIHIKCPHEDCDGNLDRRHKECHWQPTAHSEQGIVGYKMPSLIAPINDVTTLYYEFRTAKESPSKMSDFFSMRLAEPYSEVGHKIGDNVLQECASEDYQFITENDCAYAFYCQEDKEAAKFDLDSTVMGVDVSPSHLDVSISVAEGKKHRLIYVGKLFPDLDVLHDLVERYNVQVAVIDIGPEALFSSEFQDTAKCEVWRCKYQGAGDARDDKLNIKDMIYCVDRTNALDSAYKKLKLKKVILPGNYDQILDGTYVEEMQALSRVFTETKSGDVKCEWIGSNEDHQRHADAYRNLGVKITEDDILTGEDSIFVG